MAIHLHIGPLKHPLWVGAGTEMRTYILRKDPPPLCEHCQCILTVRHILVECNHFGRERKDIFVINDSTQH